jgi:predicted ATPase
LIIRAAENTQVWVVSHASRLVATLQEYEDCNAIQLAKSPLSQSVVAQWGRLEEPPWKWPER